MTTTDITIEMAKEDDIEIIIALTDDLLNEIMQAIDNYSFSFNPKEARMLLKEYIAKNIYYIFIAKYKNEMIGFVSLSEHHALYAGGQYGTILEFYIKPTYRSQNIGKMLLLEVKKLAIKMKWKRVEVTTPPLPEFEKSLHFYQCNGFEITGGRKLKMRI